MNANRKADLQRKLTLVPVPKPPAGLAERIKTEIPKHLRFSAERERERLSKSVAFNIRVAASILILISCAYLAMQVLSRVDQESPQKPTNAIALKRELPSAAPPPPAVAAAPQQPVPKKLAARTRAKKQSVDRIAVTAAAPPPPATPPVAAMAEAPAPAREEAKMRPAATGALSGITARDQMNKSVAQVESEATTSPISGKVMQRRGDQVEIYARAADEQKGMKLVAWKDASPETKTAILKAELAAGGDPKAIAAAARAAGLDELADSIEKKKP